MDISSKYFGRKEKLFKYWVCTKEINSNILYQKIFWEIESEWSFASLKKHSGLVQREYKRETQWSSAKRIEEGETQRYNAKRIKEKNTEVQCKENRREKHRVPVQRESKRET